MVKIFCSVDDSLSGFVQCTPELNKQNEQEWHSIQDCHSHAGMSYRLRQRSYAI